MFSVQQKRQIADAVQRILRETGHPELPPGEINFQLRVDGAKPWSWADIRNNGAVSAPAINPWNEAQAQLSAPAIAAEPVAKGPTIMEILELHSWLEDEWRTNNDGEDLPALDFARAVLARWGRPAAEPVPGASNTYFEFVVLDGYDCTQAEGIAPTYAQALSEGQHYLAQYQQDGPHELELRRVEVLNPDALPLPAPEAL